MTGLARSGPAAGTAPPRTAALPDRNRWRPIASELRAQILAGSFAPGCRLPSSAALRRRYGVSGQTVQHAMNSLRGEGLVETRPGHGWFARRPPALVRLLRRSEPDRHLPVAFGCGEEDERLYDVVTVAHPAVATPLIAAQLRVEPGSEIFVRERTMSEDGQVVALVTSYFPRSITRGTAIEAADTGPGGVFACLLRLGHDVVRHVERVTAGIARGEEARRFGRVDPPLVFRVVRITSGETAVLGVIHIVVLAERYELCYELLVPPRPA